jgi:hypothetical protein
MSDALKQHRDLVKVVRNILCEADSMIQGSVTAELMAIFVASYTPSEVRERVLKLQIDTVRSLLPACVEEIHGDE